MSILMYVSHWYIFWGQKHVFLNLISALPHVASWALRSKTGWFPLFSVVNAVSLESSSLAVVKQAVVGYVFDSSPLLLQYPVHFNKLVASTFWRSLTAVWFPSPELNSQVCKESPIKNSKKHLTGLLIALTLALLGWTGLWARSPNSSHGLCKCSRNSKGQVLKYGKKPFPIRGGCNSRRLTPEVLEWRVEQSNIGVMFWCPYTFGNVADV